MKGQIRILLLSLESTLGCQVDAKEPIVTYMPEYAAYLLNRLEVGRDGKAAYARCKGKRATVLGLEFGEKVLYKGKPDAKMAKIRSRWDSGIFVGFGLRAGRCGSRRPRRQYRCDPCGGFQWTSDGAPTACVGCGGRCGIATREMLAPTGTYQRRFHRRWPRSRLGQGGEWSTLRLGKGLRVISTSRSQTRRNMGTHEAALVVAVGSEVSDGSPIQKPVANASGAS